MSFTDYSKKAERWAANTGFDIMVINETERKIDFRHPVKDKVSFYITCPDNTGTGTEASGKEWNIWSESEEVLQHISEVIDFVGSCNDKCIEDILQLTAKKLQPLLGIDNTGDSDASSGICSDEDDDDDLMDDIYYQDDDEDALGDTASKLTREEGSDDEKYFKGEGSVTAISRLVKDMKSLKKSDGQFGVVGFPRGDNLFIWDVKLTDFDKKSLLGKDLQNYAKTYNKEPVIYMEMIFPKDYPMSPPFARVIRPRFKFLTGHITIGGSVCMEMLTKSGWRPINDIESILVQIRSEVISDPNARLDSNPDRAYDETEARQAFQRTIQRYGWDN